MTNSDWLLDKLFEGGKIDEAQQVQIDALRAEFDAEVKYRREKEAQGLRDDRDRRAAVVPNLWSALTALGSIAAIVIALFHQ